MMPQKEGYLMVDHRFSPGIPEELARQNGYDPAFAKEGKLYESATLSCAHCKTVIVKNPFRLRAREKCMKCDHNNNYICDWCYADTQMPDYVHDPFERKVDAAADLIAKLGSPSKLLMG